MKDFWKLHNEIHEFVQRGLWQTDTNAYSELAHALAELVVEAHMSNGLTEVDARLLMWDEAELTYAASCRGMDI